MDIQHLSANSNFWCYDLELGWHDKKKPGLYDIEAPYHYIQELGYSLNPEILIGDDLNFLAIYQKSEADYLFHIEIDKLKQIVFASTFPAMLKALGEIQPVITGFYKTVKILESM